MVTSAGNHGPIGVLGGSFDPIHHGHLRLAEEASERLGLAQVLLIPARPWQRGTLASAEQRLAMVEIACRGNPRLRAEGIEVARSAPSYTIDTLRALRERHGSTVPLWLVLGADAFLRLPTWRAWEQLRGLCHLAVVPRPGVDIEARPMAAALTDWWDARHHAARGAAGGLALLDAPELEISATAIRAQLASGRTPRYLLPDPVLDYIESQGLYTLEGHGA